MTAPAPTKALCDAIASELALLRPHADPERGLRYTAIKHVQRALTQALTADNASIAVMLSVTVWSAGRVIAATDPTTAQPHMRASLGDAWPIAADVAAQAGAPLADGAIERGQRALRRQVHHLRAGGTAHITLPARDGAEVILAICHA